MVRLRDLVLSLFIHVFLLVVLGIAFSLSLKVYPKKILEIDLSKTIFVEEKNFEWKSPEDSRTKIQTSQEVLPLKREKSVTQSSEKPVLHKEPQVLPEEKKEPLVSKKEFPKEEPISKVEKSLLSEKLSPKRDLEEETQGGASKLKDDSFSKNRVSLANQGPEKGEGAKASSEKVALGESSKEKKEKLYLSQKLSIISDLMKKHLKYPYLARRMGWEGQLVMSFVITPSGDIREIKVEKSTGYEILDKAAIETLLNISKYIPVPEVEVRVKLPVTFKLQ